MAFTVLDTFADEPFQFFLKKRATNTVHEETLRRIIRPAKQVSIKTIMRLSLSIPSDYP